MPNDGSVPGWAAGLLIFAISLSFFVGPRLLKVAWRTRRWPEFALGFFIVTDALGSIGIVLALRRPESELLSAVPLLLTVLGAVAFYTATWRVFRPDSNRGAIVAVLGALLLLGCWAGRVWIDGDPALMTSSSPWNLLLLLARCGSFAWWALEALLYSRKVSRQEKVGLAEPGSSLRFLLWSLIGVAALSALCCLLVLALLGMRMADVPALFASMALAVVVATAAAYVSFFWPSLLTRRAAAGESAS